MAKQAHETTLLELAETRQDRIASGAGIIADLVKEFTRPTTLNHTLRCGGCGTVVPGKQPGCADGDECLCFTCRQLAHAAENPYRWGIVEGSA